MEQFVCSVVCIGSSDLELDHFQLNWDHTLSAIDRYLVEILSFYLVPQSRSGYLSYSSIIKILTAALTHVLSPYHALPKED